MNKATINLVDELGTLLADKADLELREKAIKTELKRCGVDRIEGSLFDATVVRTIRNTLNMAAAKAKLSRQFILANTSESESVSVRVTARRAV